jgi:hypothetical protein
MKRENKKKNGFSQKKITFLKSNSTKKLNFDQVTNPFVNEILRMMSLCN